MDILFENTRDDEILYGSLISVKYESCDIYYENVIDDFQKTHGSIKKTVNRSLFKKIYHFKVISPSNPDIGLITFKDGRQYMVDIGYGDTALIPDDFGKIHQAYRSTGATCTLKDPIITISKEFWDLSANDRAYVIGHEIGHLNMHSFNTKNKNLDKRFIRCSTIEAYVSNYVKSAGMQITPKEIKFIMKLYGNKLSCGIRDYLKKCITKANTFDEDKALDEIRNTVIKPYIDEYYKAIKDYKEFIDKGPVHLNVAEIEADVFSSNYMKGKNKSKVVKKSLDKYANIDIKELKSRLKASYQTGKISKDDYEKRIALIDKFKEFNDIEVNIRAKAVNDERLQYSKYYKGHKD